MGLNVVRAKLIILAILLINVFSLAFVPQADVSAQSFNPTPPIQEKVMSEEENIDSFDVNPKSGRWNVSTDDTTDDLITDSQLRLITTNNETSGSSKFDMNRGMRKSDGKVEWRSMSNGGGNQTEYFRDQIGDSADFEEDDEGFVNRNAFGSITQENGILIATKSTANNQILSLKEPTTDFQSGMDGLPLTTYEVKLKHDWTFNILISLFRDSGTFVTYGSAGSVTIPNEWSTVSFSITSTQFMGERGIGYGFTVLDEDDVATFTTSVINIEIEYIKLIGSLDFATQVEGEIEDTWDWEEDNEEYFFTAFGNISDFEDGSTENWTDAGVDDVSIDGVTNGWLNTSLNSGDTTLTIVRTSLSIDSTVYNWLTFEYYVASGTITNVNIFETSAFLVCTDATNYNQGDFALFSCDLDLDPDWASTETIIFIQFEFTTSSTHEIDLNFVFLYDQELGGDREGWTSDSDLFLTHPEGYLMRRLIAGSVDEKHNSPINLNIDTSLFTTLQIRIKPLSEILILIKGFDGSIFQILSDNLAPPVGSWTILEIDLTESEFWLGTFERFRFRFDESDGTLEGDEIVLIDYVLLLGHWAEPDSVIGLSNPDTFAPVLNITSHFWANSSLGGRFEIELLDQSGELAYYFISENFTNLGSEWIRGKIQYNIFESQLIVDLSWDNDSRIFRIKFPGDLTVGSGRTPSLFILDASPDIFLSTYTAATSWQQLTIDFINAPFKELEWTQWLSPGDADWTEDTWHGARITGGLTSKTSAWNLTVPELDSITATMRIEFNDTTPALGTGSDIRLLLYGIDADDGESHAILAIVVERTTVAPGFTSIRFVVDDSGSDLVIWELRQDVNDKVPVVDFNIIFRDDRSKIDVFIRGFLDENSDIHNDTVATIDLTDFVDDPSQEFQVITFFSASNQASNEILMNFESFDFLQRDLFGSPLIVNPTIGNLDPISNFFATIFRWLAEIFAFAIDGLGFIFTVVIQTLQNVFAFVIEGLQNALVLVLNLILTAINLLSDVIDLILEAINKIVGFIEDIIDDIGEIFDILFSFIADLLSDLLDWVEDDLIPGFISFMFDIWDLFWTPVLNLIGLKSFVDGIVQQDFGTYVSDFVSFFVEIANNLKWVILLLAFFMITLPIVSSSNNGRVNGGRALSGILDNSFRSGFHTPDTSILGFSLGRIFIPSIILLYIAMKILIAAGTLPDFFGGLPI